MNTNRLSALAVFASVLVVAGFVFWPETAAERAARSPSAAVSDPKGQLGVEAMPALRFEHVDLRITSEYDTGSLHVMVKNSGDVPIRIEQVLLGDRPLWPFGTSSPEPLPSSPSGESATPPESPDQPSASPAGFSAQHDSFRPAYWSRISPQGLVTPGSVDWFTAKLVAPPVHRTPITFRALRIDDQGEHLLPPSVCWMERRPAAVGLARLAFAPDGKRVYGYFRNEGAASCEIAALELDGRDISAEAWLPHKTNP